MKFIGAILASVILLPSFARATEKSLPTTPQIPQELERDWNEFLQSEGLPTEFWPATLQAMKNFDDSLNVLAGRDRDCSVENLDHKWVERFSAKFSSKRKSLEKELRTAIAARWTEKNRECKKQARMEVFYAEWEMLPLVRKVHGPLRAFFKKVSLKKKMKLKEAMASMERLERGHPTLMQALLTPLKPELETLELGKQIDPEIREFVSTDPAFSVPFSLKKAGADIELALGH